MRYSERMNSLTLYADMVRYFKHPIFTEHRESLTLSNGIALLGLIGLVVLSVIPVMILSQMLLSLAGAAPLEPSEDFRKFQAGASFVFLAVIMAPLFEELLFRSWLGFRRGVLLVMPSLLILFACLKMTGAVEDESLVSMTWIVLLAGLGVYIYKWVQIKPSAEMQDDMLRQLFPWVFWGTAFCFGSIHSSNFIDNYSILLWPVALMPLILAGGVLGFVRMRFGLLAGMAFHGGYNGLIIFISSSAG